MSTLALQMDTMFECLLRRNAFLPIYCLVLNVMTLCVHAVATITATSLVFCVVVSVLVIVIMALSIKNRQLTKRGQYI